MLDPATAVAIVVILAGMGGLVIGAVLEVVFHG